MKDKCFLNFFLVFALKLGDTNPSDMVCSTTFGCGGGPIIDLKNNHVIAVHQGANKVNNYNIGIFLKKPLEEFSK